MAKWSGEKRILSPLVRMDDCEQSCGLGTQGLRSSVRSSIPISLSEVSLFKSQSSAWKGLSGVGHHSKVSTSSLGDHYGIKPNNSPGMRRWQSTPRLAPEGAPRFHSSQGVERRVALEENSMRSAKEVRCQHSQSTAQLLEFRHKQLTKALSDLEEKELSHCDESSCQAELQDMLLELEINILQMKSNLENRSTAQISNKPTDQQTNPQLSWMPITKNDFFRESQNQAGREIKKLKEALSEAEEETRTLEDEKDLAFQQLNSCKESWRKALSQVELQQSLHTSVQAQNELQNQLSNSLSRLGQLELEKELLSARVSRLEDSQEHLKTKLSAALSDKKRLVQEKANLYQRIQNLELQLPRAQMGREDFTEQVCELQSELTQAKSQASRQQQNTLVMKEALRLAEEVNKNLSSDLSRITERLRDALKNLHELEAERVMHTSQITLLETERLQLNGEKEELMGMFDHKKQEELRELQERCCKLRELQETLEHEKTNLQAHCQCMEKKVQHMEAACEQKQAELQCMEAEFGHKKEGWQHMKDKLEQEKEKLNKVAAHWHERWLDVMMTLQSTKTELEETKKQQLENDALREEATYLASMVETFESELKDSQDQIQSLHEHKSQLETELSRVMKEGGALDRVELDACRQQLELEQSRSRSLQQRLMGNPVSLEEMDGELEQAKVELKRVWDMLRSRDSELEEQQQELQSAHSQVSRWNSKVQKLEQQLAEKDQELKEKDLTLKNLMSQRDTEKTQSETRITTVEKLAELKEFKTGGELDMEQCDIQATSSIKARLEESMAAKRMKQESEQAVQEMPTPQPSQQVIEDIESSPITRKQKSANFDHDRQRRLITEQLNSLFKERGQLENSVFPVLQRRAVSVLDHSPKSKVTMNPKDTLSSERMMQPEDAQELGLQQGPGENAAARPAGAQSDPPMAPEKGLQDPLRLELSNSTQQS